MFSVSPLAQFGSRFSVLFVKGMGFWRSNIVHGVDFTERNVFQLLLVCKVDFLKCLVNIVRIHSNAQRNILVNVEILMIDGFHYLPLSRRFPRTTKRCVTHYAFFYRGTQFSVHSIRPMSAVASICGDSHTPIFRDAHSRHGGTDGMYIASSAGNIVRLKTVVVTWWLNRRQ